jgi:large subunit ribosomal protein L25
MATQRFDLPVEVRKTGKHWARTLRKQRFIPAVVYGAVKENLFVSIDENTILKYRTRAYENSLFNLKFKDNTNRDEIVVILKDIQKHPVTHKPEHVDLLAIDLKKPVRLEIEVRVEGKPIGLADGGLLTVVNRSIEIECLPTNIPDAIIADVSNLGVGDSLHVSDLNLPSDIKLISAPDMTIAVVNVQEEASEATPTTATATTAASPTATAAPAAAAKATPAKAAAPTKDTKKK